MNRTHYFLGMLVCMICMPAAAQVEVTLPLEGYFRAGQYMPVHVRATAGGRALDVTISGDGILPTTVSTAGADIVVPVLVTAPTARELIVTTDTSIRLSLREVPPGQQLVGVIREAGDELEGFVPPGPAIIKVRLDRLLVRAAPPVAMEMLQALVLDETTATIDDAGAWIAAGVQLLLARTRRPDGTWPWVELSAARLLRVDLLGPRTSIVGDDGYAPVLNWSPGRARGLRRQVVFAGVLFAIAATACALMPRRGAAVAAVALATLGACVTIFLWQRAQGPLSLLAGQLAVDHDSVVQWDRWTYFTSRRRATGSMPFLAADRPALVDAAQAAATDLRLHWDDDASRRYFTFNVGGDSKLAFVSRTVTPPSSSDWDLAPLTRANALAPLTNELYQSNGFRIAGEARRDEGPVVVIVRKP